MQFVHPCSVILSGPSCAGKTVFIKRLIENIDEMWSQRPDEIIFCYREMQPLYNEIAKDSRVRFVEGLVDLDELKENTGKVRILITDDLMDEKSDKLLPLFVRGVHHWQTSAIQIVHNIFFGGLRNCRINSHYLILYKNPADSLQVSTLSRQLYANKPKIFQQAFEDATSRPYSYLLADLTQCCEQHLRLRTNIFPDETTIVYVPNNVG